MKMSNNLTCFPPNYGDLRRSLKSKRIIQTNMWIQNTKMNIFVIKHKQIIEKVPRNYSVLKEHYIAYSHSIL